jgi:putative ATPase
VAYLAYAKKTKSAYEALREAQEDVRTYGNLSVPKHIRNAPTKLMKDLEYGKGYKRYDTESYMPDKLKKRKYFTEPEGE